MNDEQMLLQTKQQTNRRNNVSI